MYSNQPARRSEGVERYGEGGDRGKAGINRRDALLGTGQSFSKVVLKVVASANTSRAGAPSSRASTVLHRTTTLHDVRVCQTGVEEGAHGLRASLLHWGRTCRAGHVW